MSTAYKPVQHVIEDLAACAHGLSADMLGDIRVRYLRLRNAARAVADTLTREPEPGSEMAEIDAALAACDGDTQPTAMEADEE